MPLKPVTIKGQHPSQKKGDGPTDRVHGTIWPNAYSGNAQGGKALQRPEDLRGPSLDDSHRVGYATNAATTPSEERAKVVRTFKGPAGSKPGQQVEHRSPGGTGHHKGVGAPSPAGKLHKPKGPKTAPSALAGEGHHRG